MATLILRDTHTALEKKMESLDKQKKETSIKIRDAASHGDLKENGENHAAKESINGIDPVDVRTSYRFEQGFTYELNLLGRGDEARLAFLRGERDANSAAD